MECNCKICGKSHKFDGKAALCSAECRTIFYATLDKKMEQMEAQMEAASVPEARPLDQGQKNLIAGLFDPDYDGDFLN